MPFSHQPGSAGSNSENDTAALLTFLHQSGQVITLSADEILFREGAPCTGAYFVEERRPRVDRYLRRPSYARRQCPPGPTDRHYLHIDRHPQSQSTATAMLKTKVVFVKAEVMRQYLKTHAEICLRTVQLLGAVIIDLPRTQFDRCRHSPGIRSLTLKYCYG
jgi:hypothetical protein